MSTRYFKYFNKSSSLFKTALTSGSSLLRINSLMYFLPCVVLDKAMSDRMASTIRHNRARGSHNIELMSTIVTELVEMGKGDAWICKHIGMSPDELLRMKQITGLASLFANKDFSDSWDAELE